MQALILKQPYPVSLSGNPIPFSFCITPYGSNQTAQDVRVLVQIMVEDNQNSNLFTAVYSQNFYPDATGQVDIDIQSRIDPYLEYFLPGQFLNKPVAATGQAKRYMLKYLLQVNGIAVGLAMSSPVFHVIKGGMAYDQWHPSEIFTYYLQQQTHFLGFETASEKVRADATSFLFFLAPVADTYTCTATVVDDAGLLYTFTIPTTIKLTQYAVGCLPSGYTALALQALLPVGSFAKMYSIQVTGATSGIIAYRTFRLDYRNWYNTSTICYRNSLGGLESLTLRGQIDFEADYVTQQASLKVPPAYYTNLALDAQLSQTNEESPKFSGDTGFNNRETADKLRDFFLSSQRFEVVATKWVPIILLNKNVKFYGNRDNLVSVQLQWQRAYINEFYTADGTMLLPQQRPCPPPENLQVVQVNNGRIQIMYALPIPYNMVEILIIIGTTSYTYTYTGNARSVSQIITNPGGSAPVTITIKARTVCDANSTPVSYSSYVISTLNLTNSALPIAMDDVFILASGNVGAVTMLTSVLANDYDTNGNPIQAIAAAGATNKGGSYTVSIAGIVTYTAPSASYIGQDWVDYQMKIVGANAAVTARMFFNIGTGIGGVFIKLVYRNLINSTSGYGSSSTSEVWIDFFSDPVGNNPLDVSSLNITFNMQSDEESSDHNGNSNSNIVALPTVGVGTKMKIYDGSIHSDFYDPLFTNSDIYDMYITILPGTGYTAI